MCQKHLSYNLTIQCKPIQAQLYVTRSLAVHFNCSLAAKEANRAASCLATNWFVNTCLKKNKPTMTKTHPFLKSVVSSNFKEVNSEASFLGPMAGYCHTILESIMDLLVSGCISDGFSCKIFKKKFGLYNFWRMLQYVNSCTL